MKFLDLLDNKIDYLFKRGKNADERTFDFFLRTVTFLILALIILCYGSFVHADGNVIGGSVGTGNIVEVTTLSNAIEEYTNEYGSEAYNPILGSALYYTYPNHPYMNESFVLNYAFPTSASGRVYYGASWQWVNFDVDSTSYYMLIVPCNRAYYIEGSGTVEFYTNDTVCSYLVFFVDKSTQYIEQRGMNGCYIKNFDSTLGYTQCPSVAVSYNTSTGSYTYAIVDTSKTGNGIDLGSIVYTNAPVFTLGSGINTSQFTNTNYDSIINTEYGSDMFIQSNPLILDGTFNPDGSANVTPTEGTENNLSVDKFEIALSGSDSPIAITQSNLLIGISTQNDFILNNIDKYDVTVTCSFGVTGNGIQSFVGSKQYTYPLATFTNDVYKYSILELSRDIKVSNQSFMDYYFDVLGTHEIKVVNVPLKNYKGLIPTLVNVAYEAIIGHYHMETESNISLVQNAYLTVDIVMTDKNGNSSLHGTKVFNLKDGTSSITEAGILQNQNPWEGEPTYTESPFPSGTGSINGGNSGISQVNNNNQTVNVYNKVSPTGITDTPSDEDYDNTIDNLHDVFAEFKNGLNIINDASINSETNKPNGFIGLLSSTYEFIPGMEWFVLGISVIVALCIILFILKVLLF